MTTYTPAVLLAATLLAASAPCQTLTRVIPAAAAPGDLIVVEGTGLGSLNTVDFHARVGGFVGSWVERAAPLTQSETRITLLLPEMAAFAPPNATPPGDPLGSVRIAGGSSLPFFFLQGTFVGKTGNSPQTTTLGTGTTQSTGGKAVVSFDIANGPPVAGNTSFVLRAENTVPSVPVVALFGVPSSPPFIPIGDGTLVLNIGAPIVGVPSVANAQGDASLPLPIPASLAGAGTAAAQWGLVDTNGQLVVSNGLSFIL